MSFLSGIEHIAAVGCSVSLRRISGPEATELFFSCQPPAGVAGAAAQAEAVYRAIVDVLDAEGAGYSAVVSEMVFLRDLPLQIRAVRAAKKGVLSSVQASDLAATTEIEQPPLNPLACLEVLVQAVVPNAGPLGAVALKVEPACHCAECASVHGLHYPIGEQSRVHAANLYGAGNNAYTQTHAMFELAEKLLSKADMSLHDVARTWIYLREMDRDYGEFNRARREFFRARGLDAVPASTAIGGGPVPVPHSLSLAIYALKGGATAERTAMTSPTLNEAMQYGADFVRGLAVSEANKRALYVSGTASVDEQGRTAHVGDFAAQADRMLVNLAALLQGQGAGFDKVVSAISYVKDPENARILRQKFQAAGFVGFPNVLVQAPVCRPELLCETELVAALSP